MNRETRERLRKQAAGLATGATNATTAPSGPSVAVVAVVDAPKPPKPAKDAAPPVTARADEVLGTNSTCCACAQFIDGHAMVQQTKRGRWRHVTCPARPAKPAKMKPRFQHGETRLPHGAAFHANYNAAKKEWTGRLEIPASEDANCGWRMFHDEASGVFKLLEKLDLQYRQSLLKPVETVAPVA